MVDEMVSDLTAGVLSPMTVHRLLSGVAQSAMDDERSRWEACFERGEDVCAGQQQTDVLYTEADGVWVHLQREERSHHEVKSGIAYRGWRCVGDDRYELVDKRVYGHASEQMPFWEGASLEWAKQYALDRVKLFVVGGDGANWIRRGAEELGNAIFSWTASTCLVPVAVATAGSSERRSRCYTLRIGIVRWCVDVCGFARRDHNGHPGQRVCRVQRDNRYGLAQPGPQCSVGGSESGNHGEQWGQDHSEPNEEAGYELDDTGSAPDGQGD